VTKSDDSRYPYTYACDFIRAIAGYDKGGTKISRADASRITSAIADILDMKHHDLACKIADAELGKTEEDKARESRLILMAMGLLPEDMKI
jgi:hypothetical protein